jgi:hypothetical protein
LYPQPQIKIIGNPILVSALLPVVAVGMMVHSLKYRSQTVSGLWEVLWVVLAAASTFRAKGAGTRVIWRTRIARDGGRVVYRASGIIGGAGRTLVRSDMFIEDKIFAHRLTKSGVPRISVYGCSH